MKQTERVLIVLAVIGLIMKLSLIAGGAILLVLAISALACFYYLGFALFNDIRLRHIFKKASYANASPGRIIGAIGASFGLSGMLVGILFRLQFWPGAAINLLAGIVLTAILLLVALVKLMTTPAPY